MKSIYELPADELSTTELERILNERKRAEDQQRWVATFVDSDGVAPSAAAAEAAARKTELSIELAAQRMHGYEALGGFGLLDLDGDDRALTMSEAAQVGYSRTCDLANESALDLIATDVEYGDLKVRIAFALNHSRWEDDQAGAHVETTNDGRAFKRPLVDTPFRCELHQRDAGETVTALVMVAEGYRYDPPEVARTAGRYTPLGEVRYFAVEASKERLPGTKRGYSIWKQVMGEGRTFRKGNWFYNPQRVIEVGPVESTDHDDATNVAYRWHAEVRLTADEFEGVELPANI